MINDKITCGNYFERVFEQYMSDKEARIISFLNPFSYLILQKDENKYQLIDSFFSDGLLLCFFYGVFHTKIKRASFDYSSIAEYFFSKSVANNWSIAIIGAKEDEVSIAVNRIRNRFQGINICYVNNGYFSCEDNVIFELSALEPDIVIVGMGTPYQEDFCLALKKSSKVSSLIITCGGFLTQTSIRDDYYYPLIKKMGLRWLQRMIMHSHVRRRVFIDYPKFIFSYIKQNIKLF